MSPLTSRYLLLPHFIRDQLASPPSRGAGLHRWIFSIARQLHAHGGEEEINALLRDVLADSGVKPQEIEDAVRNSKATAWSPGTRPSSRLSTRWPKPDTALRASVVKKGCGTFGLIEASPVTMVDLGPDTEALIDQLFPEDPLLCCGTSPSRFETKPRNAWRGQLSTMQFIVPSPMSRLSGTTKEGKPSARCLDNTGPRRFLVVEFDKGPTDEHATILLYLACRAPLAMVVHSGGKSLHGWFSCAGRSDDELRGFFAHAVALGADPATFSRCQQVRMPSGIRDTGAKQSVLFFNPKALQ